MNWVGGKRMNYCYLVMCTKVELRWSGQCFHFYCSWYDNYARHSKVTSTTRKISTRQSVPEKCSHRQNVIVVKVVSNDMMMITHMISQSISRSIDSSNDTIAIVIDSTDTCQIEFKISIDPIHQCETDRLDLNSGVQFTLRCS